MTTHPCVGNPEKWLEFCLLLNNANVLDWQETPQGESYWYEVYVNASSLLEVDPNSMPSQQGTLSELIQILWANVSVMEWGRSPQGGWYWAGVYDNLCEIRRGVRPTPTQPDTSFTPMEFIL